jgi:hypothetical protein
MFDLNHFFMSLRAIVGWNRSFVLTAHEEKKEQEKKEQLSWDGKNEKMNRSAKIETIEFEEGKNET